MFYITAAGDVTRTFGEFQTLKDAEKAFGTLPVGSYDLVKVVRVNVEVADVPATRRVLSGVSTTTRPNARGPRKGGDSA